MSISPEVLVRSFNEQGTFTCSGFGIPPPTLTWSRDSGDLSDTNIFEITTGNASSSSGYTVAISNLTLLDTSDSIEGTYTCIGENGITNFIGAVSEVNGSFFIEGVCLWCVCLCVCLCVSVSVSVCVHMYFGNTNTQHINYVYSFTFVQLLHG